MGCLLSLGKKNLKKKTLPTQPLYPVLYSVFLVLKNIQVEKMVASTRVWQWARGVSTQMTVEGVAGWEYVVVVVVDLSYHMKWGTAGVQAGKGYQKSGWDTFSRNYRLVQ